MVKAVFNWSGGKDSALALTRALECGEYEIVALLTTVNRESGLSSMHNIPQRHKRQSPCPTLFITFSFCIRHQRAPFTPKAQNVR